MNNQDQAEKLRARMEHFHSGERVQKGGAETIGIISGKSGVGKSVFSVNFSLALARLNKKVLILDLDGRLENIEQLLGQSSSFRIDDCLRDHLQLDKAVCHGPGDLDYISSSSELEQSLQLSNIPIQFFLEQINAMKPDYDYILFNLGFEVAGEWVSFMRAVDQLILVTSPEVAAVADGYTALKLIGKSSIARDPYCVVNQVSRTSEGKTTWKRLAETAQRFIGIEIKWLAALHHDQNVSRSVREQLPCLLSHPRALYSADIKLLAARYLAGELLKGENESLSPF
ncbi:MAG: AAA family ATPase [Sporolactobacillus sp.]